jgi:Concanavalin A-like lectin/glucanases superfamily
MTGIIQGLLASLYGIGDSLFNYVSVLIVGNGTNGATNNTFLDSSSNAFSITRNGSPTQGTYTPFALPNASWSNYFNGTSDYLNLNGQSQFAFGTNNFTIEMWVYPLSLSNSPSIYDSRPNATNGAYFESYFNTNGTIGVYVNSATRSTTAAAVLTNTWTHIAFVRNGSTTTTYINGVSSASFTDSFNYLSGGTARPIIGANAFGLANYINSYISNLRVVNGTAVYTANFTPPTSALTAITNTALLTCQSSYFVDNSTNAFTITLNGSPQVQPFQPFLPTASYATSVNGGSMYFNGSTDYLTAPNNSALTLGSNNFTIEGWFYITSLASSQFLYSINQNGSNYAAINVSVSTSGNLVLYASTSGSGWTTTNVTIGSGIAANVWYHIALSKISSNLTGYVNGVGGTSVSVGATLTNGTINLIGAYTTNYLSGYISNFRIVNGTAVYTSNFTVPTAPLTAITNTQLLLLGTNGAVFDQSMNNTFVTVGSTQISTAQSKYGSGSVKFNGSTDYLSVPNSPQYAFGTGSFTIEFWIYPNSVSATQYIVDTRSGTSSTTGIALYINSSGYPVIIVNNATLFTSSTALTISTWTHVAVSSSGTTATLYLNGTKPSTGSGTYSVSLTDQYLRIGATAGTAASFLNAYLYDIRITPGQARYTANFTAPTQVFPTF